MILLDTHVWLWWTHASDRLPKHAEERINAEENGIGVSVISCWEIAKLVEYGLHRKVSAGNKTWNGAATLAKLSSLTASCRQLGIDFVRLANALLRPGGEEAIRFWEWDRIIEPR